MAVPVLIWSMATAAHALLGTPEMTAKPVRNIYPQNSNHNRTRKHAYPSDDASEYSRSRRSPRIFIVNVWRDVNL